MAAKRRKQHKLRAFEPVLTFAAPHSVAQATALSASVRPATPMSGQIARQVVAAFRQPASGASGEARLSPTEREVLQRLARGLLYQEVADELAMSISTVRTHVCHSETASAQWGRRVEPQRRRAPRVGYESWRALVSVTKPGSKLEVLYPPARAVFSAPLWFVARRLIFGIDYETRLFSVRSRCPGGDAALVSGVRRDPTREA